MAFEAGSRPTVAQVVRTHDGDEQHCHTDIVEIVRNVGDEIERPLPLPRRPVYNHVRGHPHAADHARIMRHFRKKKATIVDAQSE